MARNRQAEAVRAAFVRHVERAMVALALNVDARLKEATPVDTGHARANWVVTAGQPWTTEVGSPGVADSSVADSARVTILSYRLGQGAIFLCNNVPYINRLNEGWSPQAPAGFVQAAIAAGVQDTRRSIR